MARNESNRNKIKMRQHQVKRLVPDAVFFSLPKIFLGAKKRISQTKING